MIQNINLYIKKKKKEREKGWERERLWDKERSMF